MPRLSPLVLVPAIALIAAVVPLCPAHAQVNGVHLTLEPFGGYTKFAKNINFENEKLYGGTVGTHLHRYVGIEGFLARHSTESLHGTTLWSVPTSTDAPQNVDLLVYGANLIVNLRPSAWFCPFVTAGWQEGRIEFDLPSDPDPSLLNGIQVGGGVKLRVAPRIAIRAEVRDAMWGFDVPPAPTPPGEDKTDNLLFTGGIEFALGGTTGVADADADGVPDRKDRCPGTPAGARVDVNGCPIDGDRDGVADGLDQCPDTPAGATVDARGCPADSDNDKVWNGIDQCPDTPANAVVDERGCPRDADQDGVPDGIDQCADTPRGTAVDARGCPQITDADRDGVPDERDRCPNTPANVRVDTDGCPIELSEREVELLDKGRITEREIHFETAKWDILPESHRVLDEIGAILIQWPQLRIEIGGHADFRGSDAYNLDLSQKRADAVLAYLLEKFPQLTRENYTARGYGERQPVATNTTVEGMAKNRRVEFKVLNTEELKKERERRRTLQKGE
jgi:outer membrane protein OmpA-like peptidoglycan-associated protein